MQRFALNGGMLNGDSNVFARATAPIVVSATGQGMRGPTLSGKAPIVLAAQGVMQLRVSLTGKAPIQWGMAGSLIYGRTLSGQASVVLAAQGDFIRWAMLESSSSLVIEAEGDIVAVPAISATFTIEVDSQLDLHVARGEQIVSLAQIRLQARNRAQVARSIRLGGLARIEADAIGILNMRMQSPPARAVIEWRSGADTRVGHRQDIAGRADFRIHAYGAIRSFTYVHLAGNAAIEVLARTADAGLPAFPSRYHPAPHERTLRVMPEPRLFIVPQERRLAC